MILYYYHKDGNTIGPVTLAELRDKLTAGELSEESLACPSGAQKWEPLHVVLGKAPEEEPPLPPLTSPRVIAKAITGAVRDARDRLNKTSQVTLDEEESTSLDGDHQDAASPQPSGLTLVEAWWMLGGLGMIVAFIIMVAMKDASAGVCVGIFAGSVVNFMFCLTLSLVCKTCKTYLKNNR